MRGCHFAGLLLVLLLLLPGWLPHRHTCLLPSLPSCRDATIGLATMQIDPAHWVKKTVSELSAAEKETLQDWVRRFQMKYDLIGYVTDGARPRSIKTEAQ